MEDLTTITDSISRQMIGLMSLSSVVATLTIRLIHGDYCMLKLASKDGGKEDGADENVKVVLLQPVLFRE